MSVFVRAPPLVGPRISVAPAAVSNVAAPLSVVAPNVRLPPASPVTESVSVPMLSVPIVAASEAVTLIVELAVRVTLFA